MRRFAFAILASSLLCGCQNGTVTLSVADAPIDGASQVNVRFTAVELVQSDGSKHNFDLDLDRSVNLLSPSATRLLTTVTVPAGDYDEIILHVSADGSGADSSLVYLANSPSRPGETAPLKLLDDEVEGISIPAAFSVTRLRDTALTADIDLRRAVIDQDAAATLTLDLGGELTNNTTETNVRVVHDEDVGALNGTVAASLVSTTSSNCAPAAIYVYQGANVTSPGDVGGTRAQPYSSTTLPIASTSTGTVTYTVGFLPPGSYTVALICNAAADDPVVDDQNVEPLRKQTEITVEAGITATVPPIQ